MPDIKKTIPLGKANIRKFWGDTSCRKTNTINAEICIQQDTCGNIRPVISVTVFDDEYKPLFTTFDLSELKDIPEMQALPIFGYLLELQETYKGTIAIGTPEQIALIRNGYVQGEYPSISYKKCMKAHIEYLEKHNMITTKLPDGTNYTYGTGLYENRPISSYHLAIIKTLMGWK